MKQKIQPEIYATESDRISAYKKALYKEKPIAKRLYAGLTYYHYYAITSIATMFFQIPVKEMGEAFFQREEQAQLLIRYIRL